MIILTLNRRQKQILQALYDLGGDARLEQVAEKLGLNINGLSQTFGGRSQWFSSYVEVTRERGSSARDTRLRLVVSDTTLRRIGVVSEQQRRPREPQLTPDLWQHSEEVWTENRAGLNEAGGKYLLTCLRWVYGGFVLSDSHHPSPRSLKDGEARIIEHRARLLVVANPMGGAGS